ncbi:MAG: hypothetical protein A2X46_09675 [Lentisphaerae bacterium GWF2_57_35]|nr:MAG: hypothetical protein A2X46_09675 [Lentisphaerae bacterium GWF2_57_35]
MLLLLLAIATVASISTISTLHSMLIEEAQKRGTQSFDEIGRIITVAILALTMGFLLLAGALGLWAIRSTTQTEARRRIGRFVDAMDYLRDGILAVDRKGFITGSNPAARAFITAAVSTTSSLKALFPSLNDDDLRQLCDRTSPQEVERTCKTAQGFKTLRFRSQPTEDLNLILLSDVTDQKSLEMQHRQIAQLQLIGRVARGVAHDFNNILCAISAHASLLSRTESNTDQDRESLRSILHESERGAILARHLLELSRTGIKGPPCDRPAEQIQQAASLLRVGLSPGWVVQVDLVEPLGSVALTSVQIEQVILNLGLLAADEHASAGILHILAGSSSSKPPFDTHEMFEAVIVVAAHDPGATVSETAYRLSDATTTAADFGVIQSVARSMLEEMGGRLDPLFASGGRHCYRIGIPGLKSPQASIAALNIPDELKTYVAGWPLLLAVSSSDIGARLETHFKELGLRVVMADTLVSALQYVQSDRQFSAMIVERQLFGQEADALLRAILKLQPLSALLVLCSSSTEALHSLAKDVVFSTVTASPEEVVRSLIMAKAMSDGRRKKP